jgi:hypothetical protein
MRRALVAEISGRKNDAFESDFGRDADGDGR